MLSDEENEYWTRRWQEEYALEIGLRLDEDAQELTKETE